MRADVVRHEVRALGAGKKHVRLPRILGQAADGRVIVRQTGGDRRPRLAEVGRAKDVGHEIAVAMRIERHVGSAARCRRRDDVAVSTTRAMSARRRGRLRIVARFYLRLPLTGRFRFRAG